MVEPLPSDSYKDKIDKQVNRLIQTFRYQDIEGPTIISKAYEFACDAHQGVFRKSGEPYILHPIAVAHIVAYEMELDLDCVVAALLHDVVEDSQYTLQDVEERFGRHIAEIIDGLTKIGDVYDNDLHLQERNFRKLINTIPNHLHVVFIKLADRLHNMRTMAAVPHRKQLKKASETLYVYAPLAHRLGLFSIKQELEDLSFRYREPEAFQKIKEIVNKERKQRENLFVQIGAQLEQHLQQCGLEVKVYSRHKSLYSTWKTMHSKDISFKELYNYQTLQIVFTEFPGMLPRQQCFMIYEVITSLYPARHDKLQDWVLKPKSTGYRAVHGTIVGSHGQFIEVHILSQTMQRIAEKGYAFKRRLDDLDTGRSDFSDWLNSLKEQLQDASITDIIPELSPHNIEIYTPKGHIIKLPVGSTVLDFAFYLHTVIGFHCRSAEVNHQLVPRSHELQNGDRVKIITSKDQKPEKEWLNFVKTARAKSNLRQVFKEERQVDIQKGKTILGAIRKKYQLPASFHKKIYNYFLFENKEDLYYKVGSGLISKRRLEHILNPANKPKNKNSLRKSPIIVDNKELRDYVKAGCCNFVPFEDAFAHVRSDGVVVVHKATCERLTELLALQDQSVRPVTWKDPLSQSTIEPLIVEGCDRLGIIADMAQAVSKTLGINMRSIDISTNDSIFKGQIEVSVNNVNDLNLIIKHLLEIDGVRTVKRL